MDKQRLIYKVNYSSTDELFDAVYKTKEKYKKDLKKEFLKY